MSNDWKSRAESLPESNLPETLDNQSSSLGDWKSRATPFQKSNEDIVKEYEKNQEMYGSPLQTAKAGILGLERGLTLGLSDLARTKLESYLPEEYQTKPEEIKGLMEANPITNAASEMLGGGAALALTGGVTGLLPKALQVGTGLAPTAARLGAMATEGGLFGAGSAVTDYALGDPDLNAQKVLSHIGMGAALGLGAGALGEAIIAAAPKTVALGKAIKEKFTGAKELPSMPEVPTPSGEPLITESPEFKITKPPKTKSELQEMLNQAKLQGYTEELPQYDILKQAVQESPTTVPVMEFQINAHKSLDDLNNYKFTRLKQQDLQDLETVQKKVLNDAVDSTIKSISPNKNVVSDALENGEYAANVFNDLIKTEQKASGELVAQAKKWETEGFDHFKGALDAMSSRIPDIADIVKYTPEGEVLYKPYSTSMGMTKKTYSNVVESLKALEKNPEKFADLFNIREGLENGVNLLSADKTVSQIKELKAALMEYMGNMTEYGPSGLREGFKRYAINEEKRAVLEKSFGINTREIKPHQVGKAEENITNKIFKDSETISAAKAILPKKEFDQITANYLAQLRAKHTSSEGVFSSKMFDRDLKNKESVLRTALSDNPKALKDLKNYIVQSRIIPDAASINPSGSALTWWKMALSGDIKGLAEKLVTGKIEQHIANQNFENLLQGKAQNASIMSQVEKMIEKTNSKIKTGAKSIFSVAPVVSTMEDNFQGYDKHAKKIREISGDSHSMINHSTNLTDPLHQVAPNISQSMQVAFNTGVSFLADKLPKPNNDLLLGHDFVPSNSQKEKFNAYFHAVNDPMIALKQIKKGILSNETMEALSIVHPKLLEDMRFAVMENIDPEKAKKIPYKVKISLSKFLGMPLEPSLIPQVLASNQLALQSPVNQPGQQMVGKPTLGGMKEMNMSGRAKTATFRDGSEA